MTFYFSCIVSYYSVDDKVAASDRTARAIDVLVVERSSFSIPLWLALLTISRDNSKYCLHPQSSGVEFLYALD